MLILKTSPFTTIEEFNNVLEGPTEGAIYTFANAPAMNAIALIASVGIFIWFIVATYRTHDSPTSSMDKSLNHLSTFIVVSLLSVIAAGQYANRPANADLNARKDQPALKRVSQATTGKVPLGLLGMFGAGLPGLNRFYRQKSRKKRRSASLNRYRAGR
ncbi:MAG: hypothetical protein AAFP03_12385 [Cyanobacteria bacterium J06598_3]